MDQRPVAFEERVAALCGERIAQVRYFEISYENDQTGWDTYKDRFHILDFGLDLEMESGRIVGFIWDREFVQYNISMRHGTIQDDLLTCAIRDVTTDPAWFGLLHKRIDSVQIYWGEWIIDGAQVWYPQDVEVGFETGAKVYLCASQYREEQDGFDSSMDEITVIFREDMARLYHVGSYRIT